MHSAPSAGVIGNLVGRQALLRADFLRHVVERARGRLIRRLQFARGVQTEERRALFDGELIQRQVFGRFRDRQLQFIRPHLRRLVGAGVDQIERISVEGGARDRNRVERFLRGMQAPQRLQRCIVQRLHAERHAIDAGGAITAKARRLDAGGVGLQRDFDVGRNAPMLADGIENGADRVRLHQRWRAAAEKDRRHFAAWRARRGGFDLACKGARKAFLIDRGVAHMAVEIAIRAFRQAERPVHIDAEGVLRVSAGQRQISASFTKARARCDSPRPSGGRPCFSMLVISPKVRVCPSGRNAGS